MDDEEFMQKLREAFAIEADEHLQAMSAGLIELEKTESAARRKEVVETVFREAHSLKGAARAVNRADIETICQTLESVFSQWKRSGASTSPETFDVLNRAVDLLGDLRSKAEGDRAAVQEVTRAITSLAAPGATRPPPPAAAPAASAHPAAPAAPVAPAPPAPPAIAREIPPEPPASHEPERLHLAETVRVPMEKMDALLLRAEELVAMKQLAGRHASEVRALALTIESWRKEWRKTRAVARGESATAGSTLRTFTDWNESQLETLDRQVAAMAKSTERDARTVDAMVDELLDGAKQLVMLPFERLLSTFPKQVRDLAREEGKEVDLAIHGGEVEIDKRILEEMKAPLTHLVRNAIDHGLERPDERTRRGKRPRGHLRIQVLQREDGKVQIEIRDDGAGIDAAKVKAAAVKSGTLSETEAAQLDEAAAFMLIMQSGVSTSPMVTEISGRGLGMAIVREKVEKLNGRISIESRLGAGTTFRIVLPVSVATFQGVLVTAGGQTFVLPTASIERILRVPIGEIRSIENREMIPLAGRLVGLVWLGEVLGLPRPAPVEPAPVIEAVVLTAGEQSVAFAVEAVLGEQEVLAKSLTRPLERVLNIAGATILASGVPILILNGADLIASAVRLAAGGGARLSREVSDAEKTARRLLVADDSVTSRMLLKNILETAGYDVTTAVDGLEALNKLRAGEFELVVSDVEMPRMDGFQLTTEIRGDKKLAELPVILVTALSSREHRERGVDAGANAYLVKSSFDQSNLLEVVHRLL